MFQQKVSAQPRLAREGWVPAGPEKRVHKRHMAIPTTGHVNDHIHMIADFSQVLCPPERRALREIVETAEVVRENGHTYLVARVSSVTLDSLATFETSRADLEDGGDDEPSIGGAYCNSLIDAEEVNEDGTNASSGDRDETLPHNLEARRPYIAKRQERHRAVYDATKDEEELRKIDREVDAVIAKKRDAALRKGLGAPS